MKRIIGITSQFYLGMVVLAVLLFGSFMAHRAYANYRSGASEVLSSSVTSSVHTPIVATVPGNSATVTSSIFTSSTGAISLDTAALITTAFDLSFIRVNYSAASSTQTLYAKVISGAGDEFNVTFLAEAVTTTATIFAPARPYSFRAVDSAVVEYLNANSDTVGIEIGTIE